MSHWSGTSYKGTEKNDWYEGEGEFHFPNGVVYKGQFHKGEFHGDGRLIYPSGGRYVAKWERGFAVTGKYEFRDGLLYQDVGWQYLSKKDRRFYTEVLEGLQPAGNTLLTNEVPAPRIPPGTYDTGDGFFDPSAGQVMSYDGKQVVSVPSSEEVEWIINYCRKGFESDSVPAESEPIYDDSEDEHAAPPPKPAALSPRQQSAAPPKQQAPAVHTEHHAASEEAKAVVASITRRGSQRAMELERSRGH